MKPFWSANETSGRGRAAMTAKTRRFLSVATVLLALLCLSLVFFHHHSDGAHADCQICFLIHHGVFIPLLFIPSIPCLSREGESFFHPRGRPTTAQAIPSFQKRGPPFSL